jgi:class 3 adenylate cyclase
VLFCDLVGSTALAVRLDPEDLSAVIRRFQVTSTGVITSYGGYVAKFMGDGLLAYFGYPVTHEDEAENAVRAGLDLVAKVGRLLLPSGEALQVRVGVATGLVVLANNVATGSADEVGATGETPNLAARLQELAGANTVAVSEVTRRLLGGGFVCERFGPLTLKGLTEPINAFKITGETALESRFDAKIASKLTQFVGRRRELALLTNLWERARKGEGQVALICGEPGIGKSRISIALVNEIAQDDPATIRWQCSSHHTNSPFYPVIRNLERAARFDREDSAAVNSQLRTLSAARLDAATAKGPHDRCADPAGSGPHSSEAGAIPAGGCALDRPYDARARQSNDRSHQVLCVLRAGYFQAGFLLAMVRPVSCNDVAFGEAKP